MKQHIFCFTVLILIFGLMSIGTVDAATMTECFDTDPGWQSVNLPVDNTNFGYRYFTKFAGGNTGEAGGFFSRSSAMAWYGDDSIGEVTDDDIVSASGLMNIYNVEEGYNGNIFIGHFDKETGTSNINGIGIQILEYPTNGQVGDSFRIFCKIGDPERELFVITGIKESRNWSYLYDPDDGSHGSITVTISGSGGNTAKYFLDRDDRSSLHKLDAFGLAVRRFDPSPEQLELYIDNVRYFVDQCESITYYKDDDGDGYGDPYNPTEICSDFCLQPTGYVIDKTDCDDNDPAVHSGASEVCNEKDDDCDGDIDEGCKPPHADAGPDQIALEGEMVILDGSGSSDPDDGIASYKWEQIGGLKVTLFDSDEAQCYFIAPDVGEDRPWLTFRLTVKDGMGLESSDVCKVHVGEPTEPKAMPWIPLLLLDD